MTGGDELAHRRLVEHRRVSIRQEPAAANLSTSVEGTTRYPRRRLGSRTLLKLPE
jgi:hypothetical protein